MRATLTLLFLLTSPVWANPTLEIPPRNRVTLRSGKWTPSQTQAEAAYESIQKFLQRPIVPQPYYVGQIAEILKHRKQYRVQFIGIYRHGRKVIFCNFFPIRLPEEKQDETPYWRREIVDVMDGGFWYWRLDYDPQIDRSSNFTVNGYG
jgi:hypothetical protein